VYGSLRPGMPLWPAVRDSVIDRRPATARGRLHWHEGGEWPLLCEGDGAVRGDLLMLAPGDAVSRVIVDEELLYGYDARWLPVSTDEGDVLALVLVWPRSTELGPEIPDGDYPAAARGDAADGAGVTTPSSPDRP
jgi:gamma-glutamylcyclotransferase (GGCT)/AIG2-like uncharacterized protein YtfP